MFSELEKKDERYSADDKLAKQQRAIDEARLAHSLEMGGSLRKGREWSCPVKTDHPTFSYSLPV